MRLIKDPLIQCRLDEQGAMMYVVELPGAEKVAVVTHGTKYDAGQIARDALTNDREEFWLIPPGENENGEQPLLSF